MSEQTTDNATDGAEAKPDSELGESGQKALAAERDARKAAERQTKTLEAKLAEFQQAQMSELERAQAAAQEHEAAWRSAQAEALRWRIAARFGISDDDAETFLSGTDEATLTRQAERLSAMAKVEPGTPKPDRSQGSGSTPALNSDALEQALRDKLGI